MAVWYVDITCRIWDTLWMYMKFMSTLEPILDYKVYLATIKHHTCFSINRSCIVKPHMRDYSDVMLTFDERPLLQ